MDDTVCAAARNLLGIHTHTWLTRASDGHPMCDEDEELWPCSSVIVARAILDAQGQEARYREALEETRRYCLVVTGCAEAYGETESAHLWQEVADIADAALSAAQPSTEAAIDD